MCKVHAFKFKLKFAIQIVLKSNMIKKRMIEERSFLVQLFIIEDDVSAHVANNCSVRVLSVEHNKIIMPALHAKAVLILVYVVSSVSMAKKMEKSSLPTWPIKMHADDTDIFSLKERTPWNFPLSLIAYVSLCWWEEYSTWAFILAKLVQLPSFQHWSLILCRD